MTKKLFTLTISMILSVLLLAQNYQVSEVKESNPHFPEDVYVFPLLEGENEEVTSKINSYLIREQLDLEFGAEKQSIFENIWQQPSDPVARINYLTYKVELLNKRLYSVTISGEFCGAYCEGFDVTYTFDLVSGSLLILPSFFNEEGEVKLRNLLTEHKKSLINKKLAEIKNTLKTADIDANEKDHYSQMFELYESCNSEYDDLEHFRFIPSAKKMLIIYGRCSAHYNRALDDLSDFKKEIILSQWENDLSKLGNEVYMNQ